MRTPLLFVETTPCSLEVFYLLATPLESLNTACKALLGKDKEQSLSSQPAYTFSTIPVCVCPVLATKEARDWNKECLFAWLQNSNPSSTPNLPKVFKVSREILQCILKIYWDFKSMEKENCPNVPTIQEISPLLVHPFASAQVMCHSRILFHNNTVAEAQAAFSLDKLSSSCCLSLRLLHLHSFPPVNICSTSLRLEPVHAQTFRGLEYWPIAFSFHNYF